MSQNDHIMIGRTRIDLGEFFQPLPDEDYAASLVRVEDDRIVLQDVAGEFSVPIATMDF